MRDPPESADRNRAPPQRYDWPVLLARAAAALQTRFAAGELSPHQLAQTVAASLPKLLGNELYRTLADLGWLEPEARIPCDVLDSAACPLELDAPRRELLRLALFGLPGQGRPADYRHREAVYERCCANIRRETRDWPSLSRAGARALGQSEVQSDPVLAGMLRTYLAQTEAELRAVERELHTDQSDPSQLRRAFAPQQEAPQVAQRARSAFLRLRLKFEEHLAHYDEPAARKRLAEMHDLRRRFSAHVEQPAIERCAGQLARLTERIAGFREHLSALAQRGAQSAARGRTDTASWIARRLAAIHTLLPNVLPDAAYEKLHAGITRNLDEFESEQAAQRILARERAAAAEIKNLGAIVHRFHKLALQLPHDGEMYRSAKAEYLRAVGQVRSRDQEWLASLMLTLNTLLEDLHDPTGRAEAHVDQFFSNIRSALLHLRHEIETIQSEPHPPPDPAAR